jgi:uncharacterized cupredoxin-like copper-binding protein
MKKFALISMILLIAVLLAACGSAPTGIPAQVPAQPSAAVATTQSSSAGGSTQVTVTLADNTIQASKTTFQVGVPYTFLITNSGNHDHNFNINTPVSITGSLEESLASALLVVERNKLSSGESVTVDFTFPDSAAGQSLEFSCLIKRHYDDGMKLTITVTK